MKIKMLTIDLAENSDSYFITLLILADPGIYKVYNTIHNIEYNHGALE